MSARLEGQVALITGAASGIGRATTDAFIREGAVVVAGDIDPDVVQLWQGTAQVRPLVADTSDERGYADMVEAALAADGRIDVAILNAGVNAYGSILSESLDSFRRAVDVNLAGVVHGLRAVLPRMIEARRGSITVTASLSAHLGTAGLWAYNATKAAQLNLVRSVAAEVGRYGVRVNSVSPGPIDTPFAGPLEKRATLDAWIPLRRWGKPAEVASALVFLSSAEAGFITGADLAVDGGMGAVSHQPEVRTEGETS